MNRDDVIRMAREANIHVIENNTFADDMYISVLYRFATIVAAAEREACAKIAASFAKQWWSIHCATNKHLDTTRKAHEDFCQLDNAIRARGEKNEN